jgi:aldose sugar dehydrogenase
MAGSVILNDTNTIMIKKTWLLLLAMCGMYFIAPAQQSDAGVNAAIELYFDGWATSDTSKISRAMHATCHLKFYRDSSFSDINKNAYLSRFGTVRPRPATIKTRIISMDITGNIAQAKTEIETEKAVFTDYFNLIQTNDGWFIVDKISTRKDK